MSEKHPGRAGGEKHRSLVKRLLDAFGAKKKITRKEFQVKLSDGKSRYADVAVVDENENALELHQVGVQNKNGTPVKRERDAIEDIEKATPIKVEFHPYNTEETD